MVPEFTDAPAASAGSATPVPSPIYVADIVRRFELCYRGADGLLVAVVGEDGAIVDATPFLADLGDVLPFLWFFGARAVVEEQIRLMPSALHDGLVASRGRIAAFDNHDFILGLLELHDLTRTRALLDAAAMTARRLHRHLYRDGVAVKSAPFGRPATRPGLWRTSPFNGGYMELFVDLHRATGDDWFLQVARREAEKWTSHPFFRRHGLFRRVDIVGHPWIAAGAARLSRGALVRLFKDNTNLVHGLLAVHAADPSGPAATAVEQWMEGFGRHFLRDGGVPLHLGRGLRPDPPDLKAAFASIELLCDAQAVLQGPLSWLDHACRIAHFWLARQWPNGLFPLSPEAAANHLDANTDMAVALTKLAERTGRDDLRAAARRCAEGLLEQHRRPAGYVLSVDRQGRTVDGRIMIKYQALLLKLALLDERYGPVYQDAARLSLLRDR